MTYNKITSADLVNKGVTGLPDTPSLSTMEMQQKFDELAKDVIVPKFNNLVDDLNEDNEKIPHSDDIKNFKIGEGGNVQFSEDGTNWEDIGDMLKSVYDDDGVVEEAGGIVDYVEENGGKIDSISFNGVEQTIEDKAVDISAGLGNLSDVNLSGFISNEAVLKYNATSKQWEDGGVSVSLGSLTDTNISSPTAGQRLEYYNGKWRNRNPANGLLVTLDDVSISSVENNQILAYKNGYWVNENPSVTQQRLGDLVNVDTEGATEGQILICSGNDAWVNGGLLLRGLADVSTSNPTNGQVLTYNGVGWTNADASSGAEYLQELGDVIVDSSLANGDVLTYDTVTGAWTNKPSDPSIKYLATLDAGETSVTFRDIPIYSTSLVDIYTDKFGVNPTDIDDSVSGELTIEFEAQTDDVEVCLVITN